MLTRKNLAFTVLLAIGATVLAAQHAAQPAAGRTLVRAGHLLDVKTGKLLDGQTMVVVGDTIQSIEPTESGVSAGGRYGGGPGRANCAAGPDRRTHAPDRQS
jgi:hypothetical protein